jgi:hypothetical protein
MTHAAHAACSAAELELLNTVAGAHRRIIGARAGMSLTDEQLHAHERLVADELVDVDAGPRAWFTVQHIDGRIGGRWAHSWREAVLVCGFHEAVAWCVEDSSLAVRAEYYPAGRNGDSRDAFPVTPAPADRAELAMLETPAGALF